MAIKATPSPPASLRDFPFLSDDEVVADRELGSGGFCTVRAVRRLRLIDVDDPDDAPRATEEPASATSSTRGRRADDARRRLRERFAGYEGAHFPRRRDHSGGGRPRGITVEVTERRDKPPRIALKRLRSNLPESKREAGIRDLTTEAEMLGLIGNAHPNIIGLHAVGLDKHTKNNNRNRINFVVIDQLRCTLKNKMYKWREARGLGILITTKALNDLWLERMVILRQVASAVAFLHERGIVHRDVTCANIGFDSDDCVKLFDFGLARILGDDRNRSAPKYSSSEDAENDNEGMSVGKDDDATYDMSGGTGTPRFMAPEVYLDLPYGAKVDVYSLSVVMHSVLSLHEPYADVPPGAFESAVVKGGRRPPVDASWPEGLRDLLSDMWSADSARRPSSEDVVATLERFLRGSDDDLYPASSFRAALFG